MTSARTHGRLPAGWQATDADDVPLHARVRCRTPGGSVTGTVVDVALTRDRTAFIVRDASGQFHAVDTTAHFRVWEP